MNNELEFLHLACRLFWCSKRKIEITFNGIRCWKLSSWWPQSPSRFWFSKWHRNYFQKVGYQLPPVHYSDYCHLYSLPSSCHTCVVVWMNNFCTRFVKYRNDFLPICEWMKLLINRNVDTTFLRSNRCQDVAILTVLYSSLVIVKFSAHIFFINTRRPLTLSPFFKIVNEFCSSAFKRSFFLFALFLHFGSISFTFFKLYWPDGFFMHREISMMRWHREGICQ